MAGDWLSLSEVSKILGVHPSTVRNWSDQGYLPVHRTKGGHRRFQRGEVELWMQSQRENGTNESHLVVQNALKRTRLQISEGRLESEEWYQKLDEDAREQYRRSGRALLQGLAGYLADDGESAEAEARSLGYEYASRGWRYGLGCSQATHAFLFFRNVLMDSMLAVYEAAAVNSPQAWSEMFRKIGAFTDQILITLLETYDAYQRGNR
ncbi:MAG TPA: helix-turn-helix domain-containing protein [Anaerolineales bacterium]|jgi:excisionase family DNA binding protein|nr:helix-turn-helix domain-containing protein [Anaerolineales bacterium]